MATQSKPCPQSDAVWQGRLYLGVHVPVVGAWHTVGSCTVVQFPPSASQWEDPPPEQVAPDIAHAIPAAQSESVVHGPGSHLMIASESHGTSVTHSSPFAHAGALAHWVTPLTWQVNPSEQSEFTRHEVAVDAMAWVETRAPPARTVAARMERRRIQTRELRIERPPGSEWLGVG